MNDFIAVFDSGVGGISVLRELVSLMPEEDYVYFGDSANAPYGEKSVEEVRRLTISNIDMLINMGAKAVVVACNTATSAAVGELRIRYSIPVIGIEPAVKPAVEFRKNSCILVMATAVTLNEEKFRKLVEHFEDEAEIIPVPCYKLAGLIEEGKTDCDETYEYLKSLLSPYIGKIDSVVLGCTHYPFVKKLIQQIVGDDIAIFDGGEGTARETKRRLLETGLKNIPGMRGSVRFINSSESEKMDVLCKKLLESENNY